MLVSLCDIVRTYRSIGAPLTEIRFRGREVGGGGDKRDQRRDTLNK